jgi:hypothetical protein
VRELIIKEKTGFQSILPFEIFEENGTTLFYSSDFTNNISKGNILKFNLPFGKYLYNGSFQKLPKPVSFKDIDLPKAERNFDRKKYKIVFKENPNKCSIIYDAGLIIFDNIFKSKPLYVKYAIYYHEIGHHKYKTEEFADLYSVKKMLQYGFNKSQICMAFLFSLSEKSISRVEKIIGLLTNNNA